MPASTLTTDPKYQRRGSDLSRGAAGEWGSNLQYHLHSEWLERSFRSVRLLLKQRPDDAHYSVLNSAASALA